MENRRRHIVKTLGALLLGVAGLGSLQPAAAQVNAEQVMLIGRNVMSMEDYMLAIQYFNQAIKAKPYLSDPYYYRALAKLNLEDYKGAEYDCTLALERNKFKSEAYKLRGFSRQYLGKLDEAVADYNAGLEYYPLDRWFLYYKALALTEQEKFESADSTFSTLMRAYPGFEEAYAARANSYIQRNDTTAAIADLDKALSIQKNLLSARMMRMQIAAWQHRWKDALADIDEALRLKPQEADLYINRGFLRYNDDDWFGAMSDYNYALELEPDNTAARFNRALLRYETRDLAKAREDLTSVLELDPKNFHARYNRGLVNLEEGKYKEALADFEEVAKRYPRYYTVYYAIAECKRNLGDLRAAGANIRKADSLVAGYVQNPVKNPLDKPAIAAGNSNDRGREQDENESETDVMERFNRLVTVSSNSGEKLAYNEKSRGKVQDRSLKVEPEAPYILTFSDAPTELRTQFNYFRELDRLNQYGGGKSVYLTNHPLPTDSASAASMFRMIDELTARIESAEGIANPRAVDFLTRGIAYSAVKNYRAAIKDLSRAVDLEPRFTVAYMARACAYDAESKSASIEDTSTFGKTPGNNQTANAGENLLRQASVNAALDDLEKVLKLNPRMIYAWYNKGLIHLLERDYTSALQSFNEAINLSPTFGEAYYNRGLVYLQVGNKQHAFADLSKAGELGVLPAYPLLKRMK